MTATRRRLHLCGIVALILAVAPIFPCPAGRWCRDDQRIWRNLAHAPGRTPQETAAVLRWAEDHGCRTCNNLGWTSPVRWRWHTVRREINGFW